MIALIVDLLAYLKAVFIETWQKIFTFFDILGIVLFFYPQIAADLVNDLTFVRIIGLLIFFLSFLSANFSLYRKLAQDISYQAEIRLKILQKSFSHSYGSRDVFRDIRKNPNGFNKQGLPDWATLWARIEIANIGYEGGKLLWEIDQAKLKLPSLFDSRNISIGFNPPIVIEPRKSYIPDFFFDVPFTEQEPQAFAQALKLLVKSKKQYQIVIRYRTKRVDGESKPRELQFKGNFEEFYQKILKYWNDYGFGDLVKLA
jgi:hypothetical protein